MNFNEIRDQVSKFRDKLSAFIETLPASAEGVTLLNKKGNCGVVNFSTMAKNKGIFCADYYLNHTAKKELQHVVKKTPLENLDKVIVSIIQTGRIPYKPIKMNPEFVKKLRDMWEKEMNVVIFLEHDVIATTCSIDRENYLIPENTQGTIIHLHRKEKEDEAFVIEFSEGRIVTVNPKEIRHA